jgi:DNA-directed RNA polymerase specialized sigma24 family protein
MSSRTITQPNYGTATLFGTGREATSPYPNFSQYPGIANYPARFMITLGFHFNFPPHSRPSTMSFTTLLPSASWQWLKRTLHTTRWSVVQRSAADKSGADAEEFCRCYWFPLYSFLRQSGYSQADSEDHVQSFLTTLMAGDSLAKADPARGKMRNYLLTLLTRHVADRRERDYTQKRGGRVQHLPLEWDAAEAAWARQGKRTQSPEESYRTALATQLVAEGIAALRRRYLESGKSDLLEALLPALEGPLSDHNYAEVAARLAMAPGALRAAAVRMRQRFRAAVQTVAAPLLGIPEGPALEAELKAIFAGPILPSSM